MLTTAKSSTHGLTFWGKSLNHRVDPLREKAGFVATFSEKFLFFWNGPLLWSCGERKYFLIIPRAVKPKVEPQRPSYDWRPGGAANYRYVATHLYCTDKNEQNILTIKTRKDQKWHNFIWGFQFQNNSTFLQFQVFVKDAPPPHIWRIWHRCKKFKLARSDEFLSDFNAYVLNFRNVLKFLQLQKKLNMISQE